MVVFFCFLKRMGSKKKNWDLYPLCLREMARVCRPGSGKAVLLTQDKKCFAKVAMLMLQIMHIWVYILMKVSKEVEISTGERQKKSTVPQVLSCFELSSNSCQMMFPHHISLNLDADLGCLL